MNDYKTYIYKSRYSKWNEEKGRREDWPETVARYCDFFRDRWGDRFPYDDVFAAINSHSVMPSMRCLMTAGEALERDEIAGYNCSYLPIDHPRAFDEVMYVLMCGTGVGFSVERQYISKLPEIAEEFHETNTTIVVPDSRTGWASSFRELISLLYSGRLVKWDLSKLRPAGAILRTFGGRSSGPEPLNDLFKFATHLFKNAAGRKLTSLEIKYLVCKVADIVVVGGVRRSALISLSNLTDQRLQGAKNGQWWIDNPQRALANNSACYTEKPDLNIFLKEWQNLYESKSGERGIFNRVAATKQARSSDRRDVEDREFGTNPCLHPDSMIETIHGSIRIADITKPTMVYTMKEDGSLGISKASASWISKHNTETINITITSGKQVRCTPDHKIYIIDRGWIRADTIQIGDKVSHLVRNRRGYAYSGVKLTTQDTRDFKMEHRLVWEAVNGPIPTRHDIHHIDGNTYNNKINNLECLSHSAHARITANEQPNNHQICRNGRYVTHANSRKGAKTIVKVPNELKSNLHQYATVTAITTGEKTDVYDLNVENTHNFIADFVVVHNCGEIVLRPYGLCNLSECVVRQHDNFGDIKRKVELATIIGTFQSTLTKFRYVRPIWSKNASEERLLGVSLTGIMDHSVMSGLGIDSDESNLLNSWLQQLKEHAITTNAIWAEKLGIEPSAAITCVNYLAQVKSREFRETPDRTILNQASKEEGATTIPKGSTAKWPEARDTNTVMI